MSRHDRLATEGSGSHMIHSGIVSLTETAECAVFPAAGRADLPPIFDTALRDQVAPLTARNAGRHHQASGIGASARRGALGLPTSMTREISRVWNATRLSQRYSSHSFKPFLSRLVGACSDCPNGRFILR